MKKIFTTLALAALALTGFAQATQDYMRVEFNVPMTSFDNPKTDKSGTAVAQGMKDDFTYCNPMHQYLDFNVTEHPLKFRPNNKSNITTGSSYYLDQVRNTQTFVEDSTHNMPFLVDKIVSITKYSIPVETVKLLNANDTVPKEMTFIGNGKTYRIGKFTFNRLPRNVAELKTLIEPNGDGVRTHCHNQMFVAAAMYLVFPRLLDCSQDCRDMIDYLFGKFDTPNVDDTYGISNKSFQDLCISQFAGNQGKDANGVMDHNHLFQYFEGATPANQYMPNGDASKGYFGQDSYTVYVAEPLQDPMLTSGDHDCYVAVFNLISNPQATSKADVAFEDPTAKSVEIRSTKKHGWYFHSKAEIYYGKGKDQKK